MKLSELQSQPKMKMSDVLQNKPESIASEGWEYLENHPFKSVLQGLPQTLTGKSMEQRSVDTTQSKDFGQSKEKPFDKNLWFVKPVAEGLEVGGQAADIGTSPASYVPLGKIAGKVGKVVASSLTKALKQGAEKSYTKVLGPTTKGEKELTSKLLPGVLKEKPITFSRNTLQNTVQNKMTQAGESLEKEYEKLPQDAKVSVVPTIKNINKSQEDLKVNGTLPDANKQRFVQLDKVKNDLIQVARAREVSPQTLRKFRQVYDSHIVESKQGFKMTGRGGARLQAQRFIANDIRRELAQKFPDVAKMNKTYSFWSHMDELLDTTAPKQKGMLSGVHAFGAERAGDIHPYLGVFINLGKLVSDNVLWNSVSGSMKSRLADVIASGNFGQAGKMIDAIKTLGVSKSQEPIYKTDVNSTLKGKGLSLDSLLGIDDANADEVPKTLGEKNNNPGNLKSTQKWQGMTGKDKQGHAIFKTKELGERALVKDLQTHRRKNMNQSLSEFMNTYAEKNGSSEASFIAKHLGVNPSTKLKDLNVYKIAKYLSKIESKSDISDDDIDKVRKDYKI